MARLGRSGTADGEGLAPEKSREILGRIGWGGRIRTFTIHINSVVSYQLDHAPAGRLRRRKGAAKGMSKIARPIHDLSDGGAAKKRWSSVLKVPIK